MLNEKRVTTIARLGLGCWSFGGTDWGFQRGSNSLFTIRSAVENGITHFDTAQNYGNGQSEILLGKALQTVRPKVYIATKMMYTSPEKVQKSIEGSLKRLRSDYIDCMYIHWPRKNGDIGAMMEALVRAREQGKIRAVGVSNFSVAQMKTLLQAGIIDTCQRCYNLLWRRDEMEVIPFCRRSGISYVAYSSLAQGILTGKFTENPQFHHRDHRQHTVLFAKEVWPHVYGCVEELKRLAKRIDRPLLDVALHWLLERPEVTTILAGARSVKQIRSVCNALDDDIDTCPVQKLIRR